MFCVTLKFSEQGSLVSIFSGTVGFPGNQEVLRSLGYFALSNSFNLIQTGKT